MTFLIASDPFWKLSCARNGPRTASSAQQLACKTSRRLDSLAQDALRPSRAALICQRQMAPTSAGSGALSSHLKLNKQEKRTTWLRFYIKHLKTLTDLNSVLVSR